MFVGPRAILAGVNIEHGANASPCQERKFALFTRLRFQLNLGSLLANARNDDNNGIRG